MAGVKISLEKNWVHYLTRPFSLFGASLWHSWYASKELRDLFSLDEPDALFVEEPLGIVRHYRIDSQLEQYWQAGRILIVEKPEYCQEILRKGVVLNEQARNILRGKKSFTNFQSAVEFLLQDFIYATLMPYIILRVLDELHIQNKELLSLAEKLRAASYYPALIEKIIIPFLRKELSKLNVFNIEEAAEVITISEMLSGKLASIPDRVKQRKEGKHFVYQILNGKECVVWKEKVTDIISTLEKVNLSVREIRGQIAFPGTVKGTARIILSSASKGVFNQGDILVTINSNPDLLPIIKKAAAIITDEGGITCHAAIISRELKIPCIIGTKIATKVLKEGMEVEVDAVAGVVRILHHHQ